MVTSNGILRYTIIIVIIGFCLHECFSYKIRCPEHSEWNLKANATCGNLLEYFCLLDDNVNVYKEFCKKNPNVIRDLTWKKGQKCVLRGNLDGDVCSTNRYQPFIFRTDGNSDCVFKKSFCQGEGMIVYNNGSATIDTQCRCDHTKGFAFVSNTKQRCFCVPAEEDCSCYKKECKPSSKLSSEYNCTSLYSHEDNSECTELDTRPSINSDSEKTKPKKTNTDFSTKYDMKGRMRRKAGIAVSILLFASFLLTWIIYTLIEFNTNRKGTAENDATVCNERKTDGIEHTNNRNETPEIVATVSNGRKTDDIGHINNRNETPENVATVCNGRKTDDIEHVDKVYIESWSLDDNKFFVTSATREIENTLNEKHCVLVIGRSGSGKSAIIRHIALKFQNNQKYEVHTIDWDLSNILQYHDPKKKQLFLIDDFCGKVVINDKTVEMWSQKKYDIIELIKNHGTVKLLFAAQPFVMERLSKNLLDCVSKYIYCLSDQILQEQEKNEILKKHLTAYADRPLPDILDQCKDIFPLMCKLSEGQTHENIKLLFQNPHHIIKHNFISLKERNNKQMCLIALCVLFTSLTEDIFSQENKPETNEIIEAVCSEFDLEFSQKSTRSKLLKELEELDKTYIAKSGDSYDFVHKEFYDIAVLYCGQVVMSTFIRFASSSLIAESYSFMNTNETACENLIFIDDKDMQKKYFDRLMTDLEQGITYSAFHNTQLKHESYTDDFCKYCYLRKSKVVKVLDQLHKWALELHTNRYKNKTITCMENLNEYEDYLDFEKPCRFSSHTMKIPLIESAWEGNVKIVDMLIKMECNVNATDRFGRSALFVACHKGREDVVELLLRNEGDHALGDVNKKVPLHAACKCGYNQIVEQLLKHGADASKCDKDGRSPLHIACAEGHKTIVERLVKAKNNIYKRDEEGCSALVIASYSGKIDVVQYLIECNANINECDNKGFTSLMAACSEGHLGVVKVLIHKGAIMNIIDHDKRSALFIACEKGHKSIVEILLLKKKANVQLCNTLNWNKQSPLFIAASLNHPQIFELLVANGADIAKCDEEGRSPLFIACEKGHMSIVDIVLKLSVCSPIILNQSNKKNRSPLYVACKGGFINIIIKLVEKGADINQQDKFQETPLFPASRQGHKCVVQYLIDKDAELNSTDRNGNTPLAVACEEQNTDIVKILVNKISDIAIRPCRFNSNKTNLTVSEIIRNTNIDGKSPLFIACEKGYKDIVDVLLRDCSPETLKLANQNYPSPLCIACRKGFKDIVETLVIKGADLEIDKCKTMRKTPLFAAAKKSHFEIVKYIIEQKAVLNAVDSYKQNCLSAASEEGNFELVKQLVQKGCDSNHQDNYEKTSLVISQMVMHRNKDDKSPLFIACEKNYEAIVAILLENCTSDIIMLSDKNQRTPLYVACKKGFPGIVEKLINAGADLEINESKTWKHTPLFAAAREDHFAIVKLIFGKKDLLNVVDSNGQTPLLAACEEGNAKFAKVLVTEGCDINHQDNNKRTPLIIAQMRGHKTIADMLKKTAIGK